MFQPAMREITNITSSYPAVITTSFAHDYSTGLIVRLDIPLLWGVQQLNGQQSAITVIDNVTFSVDIDTTLMDAFNVVPGATQFPQVVPIGEITEQLFQATHNALPY